MFLGDVHFVSGVLVRSEEQYFVVVQLVHHILLLVHDVDDGVLLLQKRVFVEIVESVIGVDHTLGAAFGDVFVFESLGVGQILDFVEQLVSVGVLVDFVALYDADAAPGDVPEADVESSETVVEHELDSIGYLFVPSFVEEFGEVKSERIGTAGGLLDVGRANGPVELLHFEIHFPH
eukprot:CAMPEP_0116946634 /NCGR_PEP_ID=MMETSP0467-20121206/37118_1 /TAXON_ID=283647 /ORGANISM="Mesodinium pulex, Strain SPMC105" /LENGTH=176 /DNA_ID=CAMNT_0004630481 /DNA_START=1175 /DNA_END=1705 /DNA_ORIENTATION=+